MRSSYEAKRASKTSSKASNRGEADKFSDASAAMKPIDAHNEIKARIGLDARESIQSRRAGIACNEDNLTNPCKEKRA